MRRMLLSRLAATSTALAATRSRLAKRELIAAVLRDTGAEDVEVVVSYLPAVSASDVPGSAGAACSRSRRPRPSPR